MYSAVHFLGLKQLIPTQTKGGYKYISMEHFRHVNTQIKMMGTEDWILILDLDE